VFNWFRKKKVRKPDLGTDMHSHLLPGLDDGVRSLEQSAEIILRMKQLGYTKIITTPHVMSDSYRNTSEIILAARDNVIRYLQEQQIDIAFEAAAEYYLDEDLFSKLEDKVPLLTFGKNYLLFETNFLIEPLNLKEFIFLATTRGYKPVLAHPERYLYLQQNLEKAEDILNRGVLFQANISSYTGYYSKQAQHTVNRLTEKKMIHMLGTDCHHIQHINLLESAMSFKYFQKALSLPLLNKTL